MDGYSTQRKRRSKARERYESRKRHRSSQATQKSASASSPNKSDRLNRLRQERLRGQAALADQVRRIDWARWRGLLGSWLRDGVWYLKRRPVVIRSAVAIVVMVLLIYFASHLLTGRVMPGVETLDIGIGGQSVNAASEMLQTAWAESVMIDLVVDGEVIDSVRPEAIGIQFDAEQTARDARNLGLRAVPFGGSVAPVVSFDFSTAQMYLLDLADDINRRPVNARYEYQDGEIVPIAGAQGHRLDTTSTLDYMGENAANLVERGRLELLLLPLTPDVMQADLYLDEVRALVSQPLQLRGFDPIANQFFTWPIDTATYTDWLEAGLNSLTLREDAFVPYIDLLNTTLNPEGENTRYLAPDETMDLLRDAIATGETLINLRVRYRPTTYEVVRGDTAFAIARKTGIPLFLIEQANSGRDLNILSVGDVLNIPSPDAVIPEAPVPDKRIVVDLDAQYLMAFENGQVVFEWPISSGVRDAPTSPGVYQILSHREQAYGSSSTLCDAAGVVCGQWEMNWFMGIYEVRPGLVNGFHGSVLLPNGNMLGDGVIGQPITFGCVMSPDEQARALYDWADIGTIVEIVSDEFAPVSDLGRFTVTQTGTNI